MQEIGLSNICGGVKSVELPEVVDMASKHPKTTKAIAIYSSLDGFSNKIMRVTHRLIMIDNEPKIPMTAVGSHAKAMKSQIEAAADKINAMMNNGRPKTDDFNACGRLCNRSRGST